MNEEHPTVIAEARSSFVVFFAEHRFLFLVFSSIIIAILLVMVSLSLYVSSGTAQLDLSRPGYQSIREQIHDDASFNGFDANGALDKKALDDFQSMYDAKLKEVRSVDAFANDVLSPESLQIDQESAAKSQAPQ